MLEGSRDRARDVRKPVSRERPVKQIDDFDVLELYGLKSRLAWWACGVKLLNRVPANWRCRLVRYERMLHSISERFDEDHYRLPKRSSTLEKAEQDQKLDLYELLAEVADGFHSRRISTLHERCAFGRQEPQPVPLRLNHPGPRSSSPLFSGNRRFFTRQIGNSNSKANWRSLSPSKKSSIASRTSLFQPLLLPWLAPEALFAFRSKQEVRQIVHWREEAKEPFDLPSRELSINQSSVPRKPIGSPTYITRAPRKPAYERALTATDTTTSPAPIFNLEQSSTGNEARRSSHDLTRKASLDPVKRKALNLDSHEKVNTKISREILIRKGNDLQIKMPPRSRAAKAKEADIAQSPPKGAVKKAPTGRKDAWNDENKIFSAKSKLIGHDLHAYFTNPNAWDLLDEDEKVEIRALFPPDLREGPNGGPSLEFLKYDQNWRTATRQFMEDLEAGRYEEEWLRQAAQASEERAAGKFDDWKEQEFEEFWGQKQKLDWKLLAGESAKVKLETMIAAGLFKVGDIWSYVRVFGRGKGALMVEKEVTIRNIGEKEIEFWLPPGQLKFLPATSPPTRPLPPIPVTGQSPRLSADGLGREGIVGLVGDVSSKKNEVATHSFLSSTRTQPKRSASKAFSDTLKNAFTRKESEFEVVTQSVEEHESDEDSSMTSLSSTPPLDDIMELDKPSARKMVHRGVSTSTIGQPPRKLPTPPPIDSRHQSSSVLPQLVNPFPASADPVGSEDKIMLEPSQDQVPESELFRKSSSSIPPNGNNEAGASIAYKMTSVNKLEAKILEVDGRAADVRGANAWRMIRCKRDNQDMGTLWEIRELFWAKNVPH